MRTVSLMRGALLLYALLAAVSLMTGCGGVSTGTPSSPAPIQPSPINASQFGHVILVVEENHSFSDVIGNSEMPYLNSLATQYGLATQYYANTHPSIGNYFELTTGIVITDDETYVGPVPETDDNVVRELLAIGRTWKVYAESLPSIGYTGEDVYPYSKRHNPFVFFTDVLNSPTQLNNVVPFTQFAADLAASRLPNFSFIVPNLLNDAHDGSLTDADTWLSQNIGPLVSNPVFQNDGLLIVLFDESEFTDLQNLGGHVPAVLVSTQSKKGYQSTTFYQHQSTLRLILKGLGGTRFPGDAATAPDMSEFFSTAK
ncbi:MAG TPA: alkaline phosphatase family protein [Terriglobales bacterium]|nr:alkaline phosphatase family protein [Terriglobales bacterium]